MSSLKLDPDSSRSYWRSLDQLADTPEFRSFVEREFPSIAEEMDTPASRRSFLKIMGASMALAGMTACRWPTEKILPFASRDPERVPGEFDRYATAMEIAGVATGLLVTSYDGRPVKVEGNPLHPDSLGATSAWAQAAVLELYDPDRSRAVVERHGVETHRRSWDEFVAAAGPALDAVRADGGRGLFVLSEATSSPTVERLRGKLLEAFPAAEWLEYEAVSRDRVRAGSAAAFGAPHRTHLALDAAKTIVSFDDDFLVDHPTAVRNARGWAEARKAAGGPARTWVVESAHTLTGGNADRRRAVRPAEVGALLGALARKLFVDLGVAPPAGASPALVDALGAFSAAGEHDAFVDAMARDLAAAPGRSVVLVGPTVAPELHALAHAINAALGNVGATVRYTADPDGDRPSHDDALARFCREAAAGRVRVALVIGSNPVATAPGDLDVAGALAAAGLAVRLGTYDDETSQACAWHLPRAHFLESWNDARAWDGTLSVGQPLIAPLWDGRTPAELLAVLLGLPLQGGYDLVRETWAGFVDGPFEDGWRRALHDGLRSGSARPAANPTLRDGAWVGDLARHAGAAGHGPDLELILRPSYAVHDGRFANLGWLQELPDPMTKITWDNAALIGPATAARLGVTQGDVVELSAGGATVALPVHLHPGQPAGTVAVALGYGRTRAGQVGDGVGVNAYPLRRAGAPWHAECSLSRTGATYALATTQDHFALDARGAGEIEKRVPMLVREIDVAALGEHADAEAVAHAVEHEGPHLPPDPDLQLWKEFDYDGHKWGMAIDLHACTGCSACTIACQAENNIPVVGRDEVRRGREMHWIRIDRYFTGSPEAPRTVHQPVTCHHCENAPCESVCPVAATVHDAEGLNVMVYNRCIGTRYCSNNCPYKVRRFNWFNNHKHDSDVLAMVYNPEVTVRSRGVMEKCTFCVQRIQGAKIAAKNERRPIRDGEVRTACEQACPTQAITFGNLNDPAARIVAAHADPRAYTMLEELNVRPRTRYLARVADRGEGGAAGHGAEGHHDS